MSGNYPAGVTDNDDHFRDDTEPDDDDVEYDAEVELRGFIWPKDSIEATNYEYEFAHGQILSV